MYGTKLCLATGGFGMSACEQIRMFRKVGFEGFFTGWGKGEDLLSYRRCAKEEGMLYQSVHAPFGGSADLWRADKEKATASLEELIDCMEDTARAEVEIMVAHAFIGFQDHDPTEIGLENYGKLVRRAEELGVKIAFENTEGEEYLDALMMAFRDSPAVGFCWDTGHEMCYNRHRDMLASYGDRLIATHINDNLGIRDFGGEITWIDDLHLLPFDGIGDWSDITGRLNRHNYQGVLTFELTTSSKPGRHENDLYAKMPVEEYLAEAYKRACRVAVLKAKGKK